MYIYIYILCIYVCIYIYIYTYYTLICPAGDLRERRLLQGPRRALSGQAIVNIHVDMNINLYLLIIIISSSSLSSSSSNSSSSSSSMNRIILLLFKGHAARSAAKEFNQCYVKCPTLLYYNMLYYTTLYYTMVYYAMIRYNLNDNIMFTTMSHHGKHIYI